MSKQSKSICKILECMGEGGGEETADWGWGEGWGGGLRPQGPFYLPYKQSMKLMKRVKDTKKGKKSIILSLTL